MVQLAPFMPVLEEVKFMDHFELYTTEKMKKLDLFKSDKTYYHAKDQPLLLEVNNYNYLMINGMSAPEDSLFNDAIKAIYAVAYGIKFHCKTRDQDFVVPRMEAQWWVEGDVPFEQAPREDWHWNIAMPMPGFVNKQVVEQAMESGFEKKNIGLIKELEFRPLNEGQSVQMLHLGSYDAEGPTIEKLMNFVNSKGLCINGHHHEIYLSDPMKTAQEKLRTIIRYPVK